MPFRRGRGSRLGLVLAAGVLVALPWLPGLATAGPSGQLPPYAGATGSPGSFNATFHCASFSYTTVPWVNATAGTGGFANSGSARTCAGAPNGSSEETDAWVAWNVPVKLANTTDVIEARVVIQSTVTWNVTAGGCTGVNGSCPTNDLELGAWTYFAAWITITDLTTGRSHADFFTSYSNGSGYLVYGSCATCRSVAGGTVPAGRVTTTYELAPAVAVPRVSATDRYAVTVTVEEVSVAQTIHVGGPIAPSHAEYSVVAGFSVPAIQQA